MNYSTPAFSEDTLRRRRNALIATGLYLFASVIVSGYLLLQFSQDPSWQIKVATTTMLAMSMAWVVSLDFIGNKDFGHKFSGIFLWSTRRLCKLQAMTMTRSEKPSFVLRKTSLTHRERLMPAIACSILTRTLDILRLFVFSFSVNSFLRGFFSAESSCTLSVHTLENPYPSAASCLPDT